MNCTDNYSEEYKYDYVREFFLLTTLFNTIYFLFINCNINIVKKEIREKNIIKPPSYSSI